MRIGYPCINRSIGCTPSKTFRLASYSDDRIRNTVQANLSCLEKILEYNVQKGLLFLRITSDLVPFASHPVCRFPWQEHFLSVFASLGRYIRDHRFRISLHPDQFVLINTPDPDVLSRSTDELIYHAELIGLMGLDTTAKIQIHVGGVYGDKPASIERFIHAYDDLDERIRRHLVIENDARLYSAADCLAISDRTGIPVLFDVFHHAVNNNGEPVREILDPVAKTWANNDGLPMVDYSSQQTGKRPGAHAEHIDPVDFKRFLKETAAHDLDIMLEIKDKEKSAMAALSAARNDPRLITGLSLT
ncbi:MAG: UV DNA damage repair endonuclease UvsE [Methanoregula sp.]|jgi:UV DNA damage endonuclease|uniref:UV DNA damage repair endonuclease UvsE n=1 Tax=Methanoregula sp. TaxID=2052170 RepID=UPI003C1D2336